VPPVVEPDRRVSASAAALTRPLNVYRINFSWLVRLRWWAIVGQLIVIAAVDQLMQIPLRLPPLAGVVAFEIASNIACAAWLRRDPVVTEAHVGLLVALDLVLFSVLLFFTGGPTNPFSFLYLVHIALAALVLRPRWMWALVALALACSAALFIDQGPPLPSDQHAEHAHHGHEYGMHRRGMWFALGVAASFIVYFLHRVTRELAEREAELSAARQHTERSERLASLATLAAGAAHELATPLSTIAVVTRELERRLESASDTGATADARLIREQVERCRAILNQLAVDAGEPVGDALERFKPGELVRRALEGVSESERIDVRLSETVEKLELVAMPRPLAHAVRSLLNNALDASSAGGRIELAVDADRTTYSIAVRDSGPGMAREVQARAVEPFFTTKPAGQGMGLGLFLTQSVAEQHGGRLELDSAPGRGTLARLVLPLEPPATICRITPAGVGVPG
jgi:two-component system sensor histidine kinase RegB